MSWLLFFSIFGSSLNTLLATEGYVLYCPCMGRFGNQADHFLGSFAFAKGLNRTLVLPPWIEYIYGEVKSIQVPFDSYFDVGELSQYHRVVTMEHFMKHTAPSIWPPESRIAFCYMARDRNKSCDAKQGNPFGPFWDTFGVDFVGSELYSPLHYDIHHDNMASKWNSRYSIDEWPVLSFSGPPATFPVQKENVGLHKYLKWSFDISQKADEFIKKTLPKGAFIGIHLRNGLDWARACSHVKDSATLFSSPQCFGYRLEYGRVTYESCHPSNDNIVKHLKRVIRQTKDVASVFVASDNDHMISFLQDAVKRLDVHVLKYPKNSPHVDLAILGRANHFIGNCVSSFSAFAKRERDVNGLPSSFWAFPPPIIHQEL